MKENNIVLFLKSVPICLKLYDGIPCAASGDATLIPPSHGWVKSL